MLLEGLRRSLIIQESKEWPGPNHELHRLQQTTIKGEEAALSKPTFSSQETTFRPLAKTKTPSQKTRRRKRSISCHTITSFAKLHENSQIPHDIRYSTNPFKRFPNNLLHDTCFQGIILPLFSTNSPKSLLVYSSSFILFLLILCIFTITVCCSFLLIKGHHNRSTVLLTKKAQHSSRSRRSAPSAFRQIYRPGLEFWAQQPINTS